MLAALVLGATASLVATAIAGAAPATADDTVLTYGDAGFYGSTLGQGAQLAPLVGIGEHADGKGYWLVASDGGVFSYGNAHFYGSTGDIHLDATDRRDGVDAGGPRLLAGRRPTVVCSRSATRGSTARPARSDLNAADHRHDADADRSRLLAPRVPTAASSRSATRSSTARPARCGSMSPVVGMAATPSGHGYWLVASDGGIFSFGDAEVLRLHRRHAPQRPDRRHGRDRRRAAATGSARETAASSRSATRGSRGSGAGQVCRSTSVVQIAGLENGKGYRLLALPLPLDTPVLRPGDSGAAVASLQQRLFGLGYWIDAVDGWLRADHAAGGHRVPEGARTSPAPASSTSARSSGSRPRAGRSRTARAAT